MAQRDVGQLRPAADVANEVIFCATDDHPIADPINEDRRNIVNLIADWLDRCAMDQRIEYASIGGATVNFISLTTANQIAGLAKAIRAEFGGAR